MKNIISFICPRRAMSLTEIILAMALLATAFIPIIGVMGTSIRATDKDDLTIKAVNLCQEKLNQALQFPFGSLEPGPKGSTTYGATTLQELTSSAGTNRIVLKVGPDSVVDPDTGQKFEYTSKLTVADEPGEFNVPMYDPIEKLAHPDDPNDWNWTNRKIKYEGIYYRYTMTLKWKDKGSSKVKEYALSTFKSKARGNQ